MTGPATERTPESLPPREAEGEQFLVPGVRPVTIRERLEWRMAAPLLPAKPQKPLDIGLWNDTLRNQLDLFDLGGSP